MTDDASIPSHTGGAEKPFWEWLQRSELRLPRCASCMHWQWPALWRCPRCGSFENDWTPVSARGTVYSWTRTHYPFVPGRVDELPYVIVLTEMAEAPGVRVLGVLEGSAENIAIGRRVVGRVLAASDRSAGMPSIVWRIEADGQDVLV